MGPLQAATTAEQPTAPDPATKRPSIPGYEVLGELGRGGMAVVYKARQVSLNRLVALKMILAGEHAGPEAVARFKVEAEAVARLQHPNVVQVYEVGEHQGCPYLALELVEGRTLAQQCGGTPQSPAQAAALLEVLAQAVQHAHERGIVHRDLKPGNVLLACREGERRGVSPPVADAPDRLPDAASLATFTPKITDFGLAKRLEGEAGQTQSGAIVGTPGYMAPEQARGKTREVGPATDVYALGAILYELLTGRPPFQGEGPIETVLRLLEGEPVPVARLRPECPRDLETICLKCLRKDPQQRYASAAALADDLRRFLHGEPIRARPLGPLERGLRWAKRRRVPALLLAAVLAALTVGIVARLWQRPPPGPASLPAGTAGKEPKSQPDPLPADLRLVPRTALGFICVREADLVRALRRAGNLEALVRPLLGPEVLATFADKKWRMGLSASEVERETGVFLRPRTLRAYGDFERLMTTGRTELTIYRTVRPYDREKVLRALGPRRQVKQHHGKPYHTSEDVEPKVVYFAGARVLVTGHPEAVRTLLERLPPPDAGPLRDALQLAAGGHHLVLSINPPPEQFTEWWDALSAARPAFRPHANALAEARCAACSLDLLSGQTAGSRPQVRSRLYLYFPDEASARSGSVAAAAALALTRKELEKLSADVREFLKTPAWLRQVMDSVSVVPYARLGNVLHSTLVTVHLGLAKAAVRRRGRVVEADLLLPNAPDLVGGIAATMDVGMREESRQNLRKIGQALRAYEEQHGHLPPAVHARDGRPLLSWRVLLLPHLGEEKLFKQFRLDEPWDSPHNRGLLEQIPSVYQHSIPLSRTSHGTLWQVLVGPGTLFAGRSGLRSGAAPRTTILVAEGRQPVPWTRPEDLIYRPAGPLPALGGIFPDGFYLLGAGGHVRFVRRNIAEEDLRALMTHPEARESDEKMP
jgi:hypothetical protein